MLAQQGNYLSQTAHFGLLDGIDQQAGRDIDTVEDVADVMENAGGDFGHAGLARGLEKSLPSLIQPGFGQLALGHVPENDLQTDGLSIGIEDRRFDYGNEGFLTRGAAVFLHGFKQSTAG